MAGKNTVLIYENRDATKQSKQMIERQKKAAALRAAEMVPDHTVIGLGSGSTVKYLIEELGRQKQKGQIDIQVVTSSYESQFLAHQYGIPVLVLTGISTLALTIDGADEIDDKGNAIKGKGGAQTLEKVLAWLSERYILIADSTKLVETLGEGAPVPIELIPEAVDLVQNQLAAIGCKSSIRTGDGKVGPVMTDLGNIIIDAYFETIEDPRRLAQYLNNIPGVLGHGLFVNMVDQAVVGVYKNGKIKTELYQYERIKEPGYKL
jgi:ribose 5-phosphate isomerase A